jgi:hypothetical protein
MGLTVWYEPPPGAPRSNLNRGGYYVESARTPAFITKLSKARPITIIPAAVCAIAAFCYVPLSKYPYIFVQQVLFIVLHKNNSNSRVCLLTTNFLLPSKSPTPTTAISVGQTGLPSTMSPEHVAAQRAYMRYHNMNPIFGISSKRARAADPDP